MADPIRDPETGKFVAASGAAVAEPEPQQQTPPAEETPTPDPKPETPPAKEKPAGKEDMTGVNHLVDRFLGIDEKPKEKEKKAPEPKTKETPAPKVTPAPAAKKAPEPPRPLTAAEIAAAAAEGVTRAHAATRDKAPEVKPATGPELPPKEKRRYEVLKHMEKLQPEHKGIAERFRTNHFKLQEYHAKWTKEHPGEEFDDTDPQHEEFFKSHDVDWEDEDYIEAAADLRVESRRETDFKDVNSRLSKFEKADKLRNSEPQILQQQNQAANVYWKIHGPEFEGIVNEKGIVDQKKVAELATKDPVTMPMRIEAAIALDNDVRVIYALMSELVDFNDKDPHHNELANFAHEAEQRLLQRPKEDQLDADGRAFATSVTYTAMSKEDRARHWTFSATDLAAIRAADNARKTKATIDAEEEKLKRFAEARGYKLEQKQGETGQERTDETPPAPDDDDDKPISPSLSTETKLANRGGKGADGPTSGVEAFVDRFL